MCMIRVRAACLIATSLSKRRDRMSFKNCCTMRPETPVSALIVSLSSLFVVARLSVASLILSSSSVRNSSREANAWFFNLISAVEERAPLGWCKKS